MSASSSRTFGGLNDAELPHLTSHVGASALVGDESSTAAAIEEPDIVILQGLRRIMRAVDMHSKKLATTFGVTGPQLVCLVAISNAGPISQKQLGASVSLGASTITGVVDRLEARGLVERRQDGRDRRRTLVALTEKGKRLVRRAPSPLQDTLAERLEALPLEERINVAQSVQRLVDLMAAGAIDASPMLATGDIAADVPQLGLTDRSPKDHG